MSNPFNGSKNGKRGGKHRPSRKDYEPKHHASSSGIIPDEVGIYWDEFAQETIRDHVVPRKSLTQKQHLKMFPATSETEPRKTRQWDHKLGRFDTTTDERTTWRSDTNLLRTGKPDTFGEGKGTRYTRVTSNSKRKQSIVEVKPLENAELNLTGKTAADVITPANLKNGK